MHRFQLEFSIKKDQVDVEKEKTEMSIDAPRQDYKHQFSRENILTRQLANLTWRKVVLTEMWLVALGG